MKPLKISLRIIVRIKGVNAFKVLRTGTVTKHQINKCKLVFIIVEGTLKNLVE